MQKLTGQLVVAMPSAHPTAPSAMEVDDSTTAEPRLQSPQSVPAASGSLGAQAESASASPLATGQAGGQIVTGSAKRKAAQVAAAVDPSDAVDAPAATAAFAANDYSSDSEGSMPEIDSGGIRQRCRIVSVFNMAFSEF